MDLVVRNPCEAIERPKTVPGHAKGLTADEIQKLLAFIPTSPSGLRDRALVLTFVFTARRRAEIIGLRVGNLIREGDSVQYTYRGKGGKTGKRELPQPAYNAIVTALAAWAKNLDTMAPEESLWPSASNPNGLTSRHLLWQPPAVPEEGGAAAGWCPHLPPQWREAKARCGRERRRREPVPGPQQFGGDDRLSAPPRGTAGSRVGEGGGGDWDVKPQLFVRREG
jgi:site-specific recombinase XerD